MISVSTTTSINSYYQSSKPYRITAKRIFMENVKNQASSSATKDNQYYSCAAPRQYYDKNALVYMKLEQIENEDK